MSEMDNTWTGSEQTRFEAMQHLRIEGVREFSRMVPRLRALGLQECPNCDVPEKQRRNIDGVMICVTCENTIRRFWSRNLEKLADDAAEFLADVRWELIETYRYVLDTCRSKAVRKAETTTTRTEHVPAEGEKPAQQITHVTERVEYIVDGALLRLAVETAGKLARVAGMDVDDPDDAGDDLPREMAYQIERADCDDGPSN